MLPRFLKRTIVTTQTLSDKQKELLDKLDEKLIAAHSGVFTAGKMNIKLTGVTYLRTYLPVDTILDGLPLEYGKSYIPRSLAFFVDPDGNWVIAYSVRDDEGSDRVSQALFLEALTRTQNAR